MILDSVPQVKYCYFRNLFEERAHFGVEVVEEENMRIQQ